MYYNGMINAAVMAAPFDIAEVPAAELARYGPFVAASPQGTVFAGRPWLELLGRHVPGRVFALAFAAAGEVRAFVPVWERRLPLVGAVAELPPLTPYWGPLLPPPGELRAERVKARDHDALAAVAAEFKRRWPYARLACHPSLADVRPFGWAGFADASRYTSLLPPADADAFLAGVSSSLRNKIKQGRPEDVSVAADAGPFLALYAQTFARRGMDAPAAPPFVADVVTTFAAAGGVLYYIKGAGGTPAAARFALRDGRAAYDLLAAAADDGPGPLGAYLLWREVRDTWAAGLTLDLVGVNVPAIARFKESFGGILTPYHVLTHHRSWLVRAGVAAARRRSR